MANPESNVIASPECHYRVENMILGVLVQTELM